MFTNIPSIKKAPHRFQENQIAIHENRARQEIIEKQARTYFYICLISKLSLKNLNKCIKNRSDCHLNNWLDQQVQSICLKQMKSSL